MCFALLQLLSALSTWFDRRELQIVCVLSVCSSAVVLRLCSALPVTRLIRLVIYNFHLRNLQKTVHH